MLCQASPLALGTAGGEPWAHCRLGETEAGVRVAARSESPARAPCLAAGCRLEQYCPATSRGHPCLQPAQRPRHGAAPRGGRQVRAAPVPTGRAGPRAGGGGVPPRGRRWPLDAEGSGGNVCSRDRLQAARCTGPEKAPLLQSPEDLDAFLELQHRGGQPSCVVWTDKPPGSPPPRLSSHRSVPPLLRQLPGSLCPGAPVACSPLPASRGLRSAPRSGLLPPSLSPRCSVSSSLGPCPCAQVGICVPLSVKGPCLPRCENHVFLWTPHLSDLKLNLLSVG